MRRLAKPLGTIGRFFFLKLILPVYKIYSVFKKIFNKFYAPQKIRHHLIHPFSRRYLTHTIIIVISILTLAANLNAYETRRSEYGQTSIVAQLVSDQDLGIVEEEGPLVTSGKVTRYLGETGVEASPTLADNGSADDVLPPTVAGDSAVISPILSPLEQELRQRDKIVYYTIQQGDTISEIAEKFGITASTILWENNLTAYSLIRPGDKLTILPTAGIRHKVARGDTLAKIAKTYGVESDDIIEFNKLASADDLTVGEQLMIPGGKKIETAPTYTFRSFTAPTPATSQPKVVATGKMQWPSTCRRITQYFRLRHSGVDIACPLGSDIYAADSGKVITAQSGWNGGYGTYIIIDHGNGTQTLYGHLSKLYVKVGDAVSKGDVIAAEGSTGRSTGPHNHFEVRVGGARKNPLYYVQ
ncbi:MAG: peptidoglycan DD-metalloendopeptidase family protein [Candidatus Buchananbacteria bacterium]|nr:peptidoglycan DD-metalloendopeptidase family protein [Candidatus Buchananbacteria bacterium]